MCFDMMPVSPGGILEGLAAMKLARMGHLACTNENRLNQLQEHEVIKQELTAHAGVFLG